MIRRTQLRALRHDSSQSDVHECETSVRRSAKKQKSQNVSPQASQTPSAKTGFTRQSRERQPAKRCQKCLKHERERVKRLHQRCRPPDQCTHLSRGAPADYEAQSQVKKKDSCKREGTQRRPHPEERRDLAKFKSVGTAARVHAGERERKSSEHVKGSRVRQRQEKPM